MGRGREKDQKQMGGGGSSGGREELGRRWDITGQFMTHLFPSWTQKHKCNCILSQRERVLTEYSHKTMPNILLEMWSFIFSVVRYYLYQSDRKSHPCKTCRFLYFLSCWSPPVYQNSNRRLVSCAPPPAAPYIILLIPFSFCRNPRLLHISLQNGFPRLEPYCQFPGNGVFKCLFEWRVDGERAGE